jgi:hypothetical protein
MLRSIDIPARVALGFTQGVSVGGDVPTWSVTTKDYHSWVEVPFQGFGWLTFDATPGFVDPATSSYQTTKGPADVTVCPPGGHKCEGGSGPTPNQDAHDIKGGGTLNLPPGGAAGDVSGTATPRSTTPRIPLVPIATVVAGLLIVAAIAIPLLRGARRRRRVHAAHDPRALILATYDVFADRAGELGWGRSPGETPEEFRRRLASGGVVTDLQAPRLSRLTAAVVQAAYGATPPDSDAASTAATDAAAVLDELRDATPLRERVLGPYRRR